MNHLPETYPDNPNVDYDPVARKCTVRGATALPQEVFDFAEDIEVLDASFGGMKTLPDNLGDLKNLRIAFFSHNDFETVPEVLSSCANLQMVGFKSCAISEFTARALPPEIKGLILTDNVLTELPEDIGDLELLQKLMLTGNRLSSLPYSLNACKNLELLRISLNQLQESPDYVFDLPKLAWYSDSGNPYYSATSYGEITQVPWGELKIGNELGRSAKNIVYMARLKDEDVAVKIFGGGITTDGAPIDDMNASLLAGAHPNIIGGICRVYGIPDGREGFLMALIPDDYKQLGGPPDFTTLTRDVLPDRASPLDEFFIRQVATDISTALGHLASKGIMHGDIYAHNVLSRANGSSILGDFEAATTYVAGSGEGKLRELTDVRGFGYLLDDLLDKGNVSPGHMLYSLKDACLDEIPSRRPVFADIQRTLSS